MIMDIFDLLQNKPLINIAESTDIAINVGEAVDEFGIPDGTTEDDTADIDVGAGDAGDEGGFSFEEDTEGEESSGEEVTNPLEDIDDSEISLVTEMRISFATLYKDSKIKYERLVSRNLNSSDYGAEFKEIQDQYKDILHNMYLYLKNKHDKESVVTKILQFNKFKSLLNTLYDNANILLEKIDGAHVD